MGFFILIIQCLVEHAHHTHCFSFFHVTDVLFMYSYLDKDVRYFFCQFEKFKMGLLLVLN